MRKLVPCSNCLARSPPLIVMCYWSENERRNSRGEMKRFLIEDNTGVPHRCIKLTHKDKGAIIKNSLQRGIPCRKGCGKYLIVDKSFPELKRDNQKYPEPKLREVVKRMTSSGDTINDLDIGARHTRYRCTMLCEGYDERTIEMMESDYYEKHQWYLASLASEFNSPKEYLAEGKNG